MTAFCVAAIETSDDLRPKDGVLRAASLRLTSDAHAVAARIVEHANAEKDAMLCQAKEQARQIAQDAQREVLLRAEQLLQSLERENATFLQRAQEIIVDLTQQVFDRLIAETTPQERIAAALRQLLREAPPKLADPVLKVHPDDLECIPELAWDVKADVTLARGSCRLEAKSGEWSAGFDASVAALRAAFPPRVPSAEENLKNVDQPGSIDRETDGSSQYCEKLMS